MTPWTDRAGRFSPLKAAVFAATLLPAIWIAAVLLTGNGGPRPDNWAIHELGEWTVRLLLAGLAVTPFRRALDWPRLIVVRRMLGLAALSYALVHLAAYVVEQNYDLVHVASEIVLRVYLAIGMVALVALSALGLTSTDTAIRRLGRNWTRLHRLVYPATALALIHQFMQSKADVSEPTLNAGLFLILMAYRVLASRGIKLTPAVLAATAVAAVPATMALEYGWYALMTNLPAERVFMANFYPGIMIRPSWYVGAAGLAVAALALVRRTWAPREAAGGRPLPRRAPAE